MAPKIIVIGSGFAGLAASCCLAKQGFEVTILEKNETLGGRARVFNQAGYTFDMGPSWYWMPDVFEDFFESFGAKVSDFYQLERLDPSYKIFYGGDQTLEVPADFEDLVQMFERIEPGSGPKLKSFLFQAEAKYRAGMHDLVYKPGDSFTEFISFDTLRNLPRLDIFQPFEKHLGKYFSDPRLIQMLTFPILFLGATPKDTPALYSLMNYADIKLGTWYPEGGMNQIISALVRLAESLGVRILPSQEVHRLQIESGSISHVVTDDHEYECDLVVAGADYHHIEHNCLPEEYRSYSERYWEKRTMAPSSLIYYLGISKKIPGLQHHNLFFDASLKHHMGEIYTNPEWPKDPLFYVSATSKTDPSVCPEGHENLFVLIPTATGLNDTDDIRDHYFDLVMNRMQRNLGVDLKPHIVFKKCYAHRDFIKDYHAFKGNAYGLANTLSQTAFLKPKMKSKKVSNLYYTGQLTVPGPGVPPSLISGQIVAKEIAKEIKHETTV